MEFYPYPKKEISFHCETCNEEVSGDSLKDLICLLCDFRCTSCGQMVENGLGYEHIKGNHPEVLNNKLFYCKKCKRAVEDWNVHLEESHRSRLGEAGFYCPGFAGFTKETYEKHSKEIHPRQCMFCKESVKDEADREKHMKERHKLSCPICGEQPLRVPLEVHIKRKHEICEGRKICEVFKLNPDTFKGFAPYCPADFLIGYLLRKNLVSECPYHKYYGPGNKTEHCLPFHGNGCLKCDLCEKTIEGISKEQHRGHLETCKYWGRVCSEKAVNDHLKEKHFACGQCNFKCFENKELLYKHRREKHTPECILCKESFKTENLLIQHCKEKHWNEFMCRFCKKSFSNFNLLCDHREKKYSELGTMCAVCKRFISKNDGDAKCHQFLHSVDCDRYGKRIKQGESFKEFAEHMRDHHGCTWNCKLDPKTLEFKHSGCSFPVLCPVCHQSIPAKDKEKHRKDHGGDSECPLWKDTKEKGHHFNCAEKVFPKCPIGGCFEKNVTQTHLFKRHDCGPTCRIIIKSEKCKIVHMAEGKIKEGHDPEECQNFTKLSFTCPEGDAEKHREDCWYDGEYGVGRCVDNCKTSRRRNPHRRSPPPLQQQKRQETMRKSQ